MNFYEKRSIQRKYRNNNYKRPVLQVFNFELNSEQLEALIYILELSENEFSRILKRVPMEDVFLREIYYYYRVHGKNIRKYLRKVRGY